MKYLKTVVFLVFISTCAVSVNAQLVKQEKIAAPKQLLVEKPRLFTNIPEKFTVNKLVLDKIFTTSVNSISVPVKNGITLEGTVLERVQQNPNVISINIRLHNYDNSLLNISRIIESDLSVNYVARVINIKNGDVLLLKKEDGQFYFTKEKQSLIAVE